MLHLLSAVLVFLHFFILAIPSSVFGQIPMTDATGTTITLADTPRRIVSLMPSNTELLFAVGAGNSVVGISNYCDYPPEVKMIEKVGDITTMSLEKIVSLAPDLVLASKGNSSDLIEGLRALDVPVFVLNPQTIEEMIESIAIVGKLSGKSETAARLLADSINRLSVITEHISNLEEHDRPTVFVGSPFRDENWTPGPGTFISGVIRHAGGRNAADNVKAGSWAVYSLEDIILKDPAVLLSTLRPNQNAVDVKIEFLKRAKGLNGWRNLDAVRNERVVLLPENWLVRPTTRIIHAIEILAAALHPHLF